jgi:hypothetical protein
MSFNFSDTTPAAPAGSTNVLWQADSSGNISSYLAGSAVSPVELQQGIYTFAVDTGTANNYVLSITPAPTIVAGSGMAFQALNTNTGPSTVTLNGAPPIPLTKRGALALSPADVSANQIIVIIFDGVNWQIVMGLYIAMPLAATAVTYDNATYPSVEAALNFLMYVPLTGSLTNDHPLNEIGIALPEVTLTWTYNKGVLNQTLESAAQAAPLRTLTILYSSGLSLNHTYGLVASDGVDTLPLSTSVAFLPQGYWGVSPNLTLTNAQILALGSSALSSNRARSMSYNASSVGYPFYCYPVSFGLPANVTVSGLAFSDYSVTTQSMTNASGYAQNYYILRFNNIQTGANINVVWS